MPPPRVFLRSVGFTPVTRSFSTPHSLPVLAQEAVNQALAACPAIPRSDITCLIVGNMLSPVLQRQSQLATLLASACNLDDVETLTIDAACGSGGQALRQGVLALQSGAHKHVLVLGIEEMNDPAHKPQLSASLAQASHWQDEGSTGTTFIGLNSHLTTTYLERYPRSPSLYPFPANAHANAATASHALLRKPLTEHDYNASKPLAPHIRLYDACPTCSGAAALLLSLEGALGQDPSILGSASATDRLNLKQRADILDLRSLRLSSQQCFAQASLQPRDIDLFEAHDAYSIMSVLSLEAAGFCSPGEGPSLACDIHLRGRIPLSSFGGLKARGHPVGASGVYQACEAYLQLTQRAGPANQIPWCNTALIASFGGAATTCATHIVGV